MGPRKQGLKGVSTALATIAIISVLVLGMSWMAYTVLLNAQQQAAAAGRGETAALKAKELVRVYIWPDPAKQPDGRHLNLTRITFVNEWSGETMINSLLIVYNNAPAEVKSLNLRLGAGERKTYLPSELGLAGLDNYNAFQARVRYVQAHTSLGNDFVSLWGEPGKPALYVTGTTSTDTYTVTTTETTYVPTTTTRSRTTTSYTATVTVTTTVYYGNPYMNGECDSARNVHLSFNPGTWGSPPYWIIVEFIWANQWDFVGGRSTYEEFTNGAWGRSWYELYGYPPDYHKLTVTFTVVSSDGRGATIEVRCPYSPPINTGTTSYTASTGPPTTVTGTATVWYTETITETTFVGGGYAGSTVTVTSTYTRYVPTTVYYTVTSYNTWVGRTTVYYPVTWYTTWWSFGYDMNIVGVEGGGASCPVGDLAIIAQPRVDGWGVWRPALEGLMFAMLAGVVHAGDRLGRRRVPALLATLALLTGMVWASMAPVPASGQAVTMTTYVTTTVTINVSGTTYTVTQTVPVWVTETYTMSWPGTTITVDTTTTYTISEGTWVATVTVTAQSCACRLHLSCIWQCCSGVTCDD